MRNVVARRSRRSRTAAGTEIVDDALVGRLGAILVLEAMPTRIRPHGRDCWRIGAPVSRVRQIADRLRELSRERRASGPEFRVMNDDVIAMYRPSAAAIDAVTRAELAELQRRERAYRDGRRPLPVEGRTVILVDDGLATGSTMRAAVLAMRRLRPARVIVAVPVGARETCDALRAVADDVVCALVPEPLSAVGLWYIDFSQTTDDEVRQLLSAAAHAGRTRSA